MATSASGRARSAGTSTCSRKARKTAVLVAAAAVMTATRPSRAIAPRMVRRCQRPPGAGAPRAPAAGRPGIGAGQAGVEAALVEEDEPVGIDLLHDLRPPTG